MHDAARVHVLERDDRLGEPEARAARRRADHLAVAVRAQLRPELAPSHKSSWGKQNGPRRRTAARARGAVRGARARSSRRGRGGVKRARVPAPVARSRALSARSRLEVERVIVLEGRVQLDDARVRDAAAALAGGRVVVVGVGAARAGRCGRCRILKARASILISLYPGGGGAARAPRGAKSSSEIHRYAEHLDTAEALAEHLDEEEG